MILNYSSPECFFLEIWIRKAKEKLFKLIIIGNNKSKSINELIACEKS